MRPLRGAARRVRAARRRHGWPRTAAPPPRAARPPHLCAGAVERGVALRVAGVHVGTLLEQQPQRLDAAVARRQRERRAPGAVARVALAATREADLHSGGPPRGRCRMQRRVLQRVARADGGGVALQERLEEQLAACRRCRRMDARAARHQAGRAGHVLGRG
eukprot:scaffold102519_cov72-Phaeocystis_antarctica.AAC.1